VVSELAPSPDCRSSKARKSAAMPRVIGGAERAVNELSAAIFHSAAEASETG
jgi:hypothetical protein